MMISSNDNLNKQFADLQAKSLEPMRVFSTLAADAMEQMMQKNHALMSDFIAHTAKQAQLPLNGENANDIIATQAAENKAFSDLLNSRAEEYLKLANNYGTQLRKATEEAANKIKSA